MVATTNFDYKQAQKAIKAIKDHISREDDNDLLGSERGLWVQIKLAQMTSNKVTRHRSVAVKHSILPDEAEVCLITLNQPKMYQEKINELSLDRKTTVYSGKGFREKYGTMEAKRQAARKYSVFLVDAPLANKINSMFGSPFNRANKDPAVTQVSENEQMMDGEKIKENINAAINSVNISDPPTDAKKAKFGRVDMSEKDLLENFKVILEDMKEHLEWQFVQSVSIQADQSLSLPIYACVPGTWLLEAAKQVKKPAATKKTKAAAPAKKAKSAAATDNIKVQTEKKITKPAAPARPARKAKTTKK